MDTIYAIITLINIISIYSIYRFMMAIGESLYAFSCLLTNADIELRYMRTTVKNGNEYKFPIIHMIVALMTAPICTIILEFSK